MMLSFETEISRYQAQRSAILDPSEENALYIEDDDEALERLTNKCKEFYMQRSLEDKARSATISAGLASFPHRSDGSIPVIDVPYHPMAGLTERVDAATYTDPAVCK